MSVPGGKGTIWTFPWPRAADANQKEAKMDTLLASIQALSGSEADLKQLHEQLKAQVAGLALVPPENLFLSAQSLDPTSHALGLLYILDALSTNAGSDATVIDFTSNFFILCSREQIRLAPEVFARLGRKFRIGVAQAGCFCKGVAPLLAAVRALQPSNEYLTPLHAEFLMVCLISKCFNAAEQLLSEDIYHVDPSRTACTPRDLFLYCRYGGLICSGRKQWQRALELQLCALTAPAGVGNAIVLDCYKHYVLVSLIVNGLVPALPKVSSQPTRSMVDGDARAYNDLATAYSAHNQRRLKQLVEQHANTFLQDGNTGLVQLVLESFTTRSIQRLTSTYVTLSLADIAQQVGLPSAEAAEHHILKLVSRGELFASISEAEGGGMVRFSEDPEAYRSPAAAARLHAAMQQCMALAERVQATQAALSSSKDHARKMMTGGRGRFEAAEDMLPPMPLMGMGSFGRDAFGRDRGDVFGM